MQPTLDEIYSQALCLPDDSKAYLAERLIAFLESQVDAELEREHIAEAVRRREEIRSGATLPLDGASVMAEARKIVGE